MYIINKPSVFTEKKITIPVIKQKLRLFWDL